jgi:phytoene synthase
MTLNDAGHCRRIVRTHARTFWLASGFLPPQKRRAAFALYAFCRVADDLVDLGALESGSNPAQILLSYREALAAALEGRACGPVLRELVAATAQYNIPLSALHELLDGVARDCAPASYERWSELARYCEAVASSVGEMCTYVFGVPGDAATRARALSHARTLGVAMQLTNILRDAGEDARNGRCYIPRQDLERFGLTPQQVLDGSLGANERWKALMHFEIARARELYALAIPGILLLSPDARRCATACAVGYAGILRAIEEIGCDTFSSRARLSAVTRAGVLWNAWRTPLGETVAFRPSGVPVADGKLVAVT